MLASEPLAHNLASVTDATLVNELKKNWHLPGHHHFDGDVQEVASAGFTERLLFNQSFKQQCSRGFTTKRPLSTKTYVSLFGENVLVNV